MSDEQSVVFRTQNRVEAQLVKDILGAKGIEAFVFDDHMSSLNPLLGHALGGIRVAVRQQDYGRAERTLSKALQAGKAGPLAGNISPLGQTTAESDAVKLTDLRGLWVLLLFLLFVAVLFFLSPGRIAVFFHRTIPLLFAGRQHPVNLSRLSPETRAGMGQPLEVLSKKSQAGDKESQYYLGWKYYFGDGVKKSESTAIEWIQRAAESGFVKAQYAMGNIYRYGVGVKTNAEQAFQWYLKAAQQGNPKAQVAVGGAYSSGYGILRDESTAFTWLQKAADQGYAPAQDLVAFAYEEGQGIPQDYGKAIEWFKRGALQGNAASETNLAYCYLVGMGVDKDYKQAATLYEKAALKGIPNAQYNLGTLYVDGRGVPKNRVHAYAWLLVAASHRHAKAIETVTNWEGRLSKDEIEAGHSLATDYEKQIFNRSHDESEDGSKQQ